MPIPRELFDQDLDEQDEEIVGFLVDSPDEAFSFDELAESLDIQIQGLAQRVNFMGRLIDLQRGGLVELRNIHDTWYASITQKGIDVREEL